MNELERSERYDGSFEGPILEQGSAPRIITRRRYNLLLTGFVVLSFVVMWACSYVAGTYEFLLFMMRNPMLWTIGSLVGTIGGLIAMSAGRAKERLPIALAGYALFTLTFGFSSSLVLMLYDLQTISMAFSATAGIMIVFGAAGIMYPRAFERLQGVLVVGLLAIIVIEVVLSLVGVQQTATDGIVVLLFCGFIGYDVHRASTAAPTVSNALWYAVELYLDIMNVFLRLLSIFGRRDG